LKGVVIPYGVGLDILHKTNGYVLTTILIYGELHINQTEDKSVTDYIEKAFEGEYEDFVGFLSKLVEDEIDNKKIPLREAAEAIVSDAFYQLRSEKPIMDKLLLKANEVLDPPCQDDEELETHTFDEVVEEISRNEIYMSQKTGTLPRPDRT
jgi:hypothetical protein